MVYMVSESATFNRKINPLPEWKKQQKCEESVGHQLKVEERRIVCESCGAEWRNGD